MNEVQIYLGVLLEISLTSNEYDLAKIIWNNTRSLRNAKSGTYFEPYIFEIFDQNVWIGMRYSLCCFETEFLILKGLQMLLADVYIEEESFGDVLSICKNKQIYFDW